MKHVGTRGNAKDIASQEQLTGLAASQIHAAAAKTAPVDADELGLSDSADSWELKKLTFANIAAWIRGIALTGLSTATNAVITATDTVLAALGKLQAQITAHTGSTSNPHSVTKSQVGLGNVDNTSDANKPVSTATQTALDAKANTASPTFTGTPTAPTAAVGTNTTQLATTAHVFAERTAAATLTNKTLTSPTLTTEAVAVTTNNLPAIRPTLLLDFANSKQVDPRISFTRASTATYYDANGVLRTAASGVPRIDHGPTTGECKGLLIEEARTNLLTYSEDLNNAAWVKIRSSVTTNATVSPDGTLTADKLVEDTTTSSTHYGVQTSSVSPSTTYTFTVYLKAAERTRANVVLDGTSGNFCNAYVDLSAGTVISGGANGTFTGYSSSMTLVGNGWYRLTLACTVGAGTTSLQCQIRLHNSVSESYTGDGTSGIYIWGAQLEAGSFPTSYIPTTTAQVTRAADVVNMTETNFSEWYRQDEGTFVVTASRAATGRAFTVSDGTSNENMRVNLSAASPLRPDWQVIDNGTTQVATTSTTNVPLNSNFTVAASYKKDDFAISVNGAAVVTDTSGTVPLVDRMHLGAPESGVATGGANFRRIVYYPKRLTNDELKALTA